MKLKLNRDLISVSDWRVRESGCIFDCQKKKTNKIPGDFSLHIYPVELEDDGKYQCQASPTNDGQPGLRSRFAKLSVLVPPQKPKILQGDFLVTTEDRELVIECTSIGGKPAADVSKIVS